MMVERKYLQRYQINEISVERGMKEWHISSDAMTATAKCGEVLSWYIDLILLKVMNCGEL